MDLWIRSQDGEDLWKANAITIQDYLKTKAVDIVVSSGMEQIKKIATYNTKEKALKVLGEIQNKLMGASKIILQPHQDLSVLNHKDFEKISNRAKEELRQDIGVLSNLFDYSVANQETVIYEMPADDEVK